MDEAKQNKNINHIDPNSVFKISLKFQFKKGNIYNDRTGDVDNLSGPVLNALFTVPNNPGSLVDVSDARVESLTIKKIPNCGEYRLKIKITWRSISN